jgi:hypothetical protein
MGDTPDPARATRQRDGPRIGWHDEFDEEMSAVVALTSPAVPAQSVTILFDRTDPPDAARVYGDAGAAELVRVLRATADRIETGVLRPAIDGRMRWVETDPAAAVADPGKVRLGGYAPVL